MKKKNRSTLVIPQLALALTLALASNAAFANNVWSKNVTPAAAIDPTKPIAGGRGYIVPRAVPAPGGMNIIVDSYHARTGDSLTTMLQLALQPDPSAARKGHLEGVQLKTLALNAPVNPTSYHGQQTFFVSYNELNETLAKQFPNSPQLRVAPGSVLFVVSKWQIGHIWGGTARGGDIVLPEPSDHSYTGPSIKEIEKAAGDLSGRVALSELDVAVPITQTEVNVYNTDGGKKGLKAGGQIRSRLEAEGKYDVSDSDAPAVKAALFDLAQAKDKAQSLLGPDWSFTLKDRYMKRDASGNLEKGADGLPIPDPMVDTYYDGKHYEAAQANAAIRYRWTEGNQTGSWNIKPGIGVRTDGGVVYRIEYGLDTTDDKPESARAFAGSLHPLNPFASLRDVMPNTNPADLLIPAVKLTDYRYKFAMQHKSGLIIELSLDEVQAQNLRRNAGDKSAHTSYVQLEMDVDHLATTSLNTLATGAAPSDYGLGTTLEQFSANVAARGNGDAAKSVIRGRPTLHTNEDLQPTSAIRVKKAADFTLAEEAIGKLRDHLYPNGNWKPAAQKYAYAAQRMGLVDRAERAKERLERMRARRAARPAEELHRALP